MLQQCKLITEITDGIQRHLVVDLIKIHFSPPQRQNSKMREKKYMYFISIKFIKPSYIEIHVFSESRDS